MTTTIGGLTMSLNDFQQELCTTSPWDFSNLRALYVNCTLKPSPALSHTQGLIDISVAIMEANGVTVEQIRAVDHDIAPGVYPDMTEHGAARDEWPELFKQVNAADILVICTPIWLGEKSSVSRLPGARQSARVVGFGMPVRLPESGVSLAPRRKVDS